MRLSEVFCTSTCLPQQDQHTRNGLRPLKGKIMHGLSRCTIATAVAIAIFGSTLLSANVQAAMRIDIPAQSLAESLKAVANQTNTNVLFDLKAVEGIQAPAISDELTPEKAVERLLLGTGLTHQAVNEHTIVLRPVGKKAAFLEGSGRGARLAQADTSISGVKEESRTELSEVVVTAEKRAESIQSLPIAISAFSGETMLNRGIDRLEDLQFLAPSLQIWDQKTLQTPIKIRGIGQDIGNTATESGVSVSWNGVPYSNARFFSSEFFDMDRVEVLRGPQGTISGRNATAGAINLYSRAPTESFEGSIKASAGNFGRWGLESAVSGPLVGERLLGRLAARTEQSDGWITNRLIPGEQIGALDVLQGRGSLLATLTDSFKAELFLEGYRDRSVPTVHVYVDRRVRPDVPSLTEVTGFPGFDLDAASVQRNDPTVQDRSQYQGALKLSWQLGHSASLTSVTGYVKEDSEKLIDADSLPSSVLPIVFSDELRQISQEITLTADVTDQMDVIAGAMYIDANSSGYQHIDLFGGAIVLDSSGSSKLSSWAAYTQWRYRVTDTVRFTAGARFTQDHKDSTSIAFTDGVQDKDLRQDHSWSAWTPRFAVDYTPTPDLTLYGSMSRGFKSGGLSDTGAFDPEYLWNYEIGAKKSWLNGRMRTALTAFFMDYKNQQQTLYLYDSAGYTSATINSQASTSKGIEAEVDAIVTERFRFTFAGTWLNAKFDSLQQPDGVFPELGSPQVPGGPNFRDLSGNRMPLAPEWQLSVSGEYRAPIPHATLGGSALEAVLTASYSWQDRVFFNFFNHYADSQGAYGLLNLTAALQTADERWQLSAFVRNLANKLYYPAGEILGTPSEPFGAPAAYFIGYPGMPRTYGARLAYRF